MNLIASDDSNTEFVGARNPDDLLYVVFYKRPVHNEFESNRQNRPIFEDRDYIKIMKPGDQNSVIDTIATEGDKKRFYRQWERYQASHKEDDQLIGTPVRDWPAVTRAQAEELKAVGFHSVEQIAGCSDLQLQKLGMSGPGLKMKAIAFLQKSAETAKPAADAARLASLEQQVQNLTTALAQATAAANAMAPVAPPKRVMSDEQKAKMAAGRAAAKAAKAQA